MNPRELKAWSRLESTFSRETPEPSRLASVARRQPRGRRRAKTPSPVRATPSRTRLVGSGTFLTSNALLLAVAIAPEPPGVKNPTMYATAGRFGLKLPPVLPMLKCGVAPGSLLSAKVLVPRSACYT